LSSSRISVSLATVSFWIRAEDFDDRSTLHGLDVRPGRWFRRYADAEKGGNENGTNTAELVK
jgi:hypothetical protein